MKHLNNNSTDNGYERLVFKRLKDNLNCISQKSLHTNYEV